MTEMEAWCDFYRANDITYFPIFGITNGICRCPDGAACGPNSGKHPKQAWKGKPSKLPRDVDNVGISTDNLVIIDFDGDVPLEALDAYPSTFTTGTGHGFHLWYKADPSKDVKSEVGWRHKIDTRAKGGILIVPPSRHRNGGVYRHIRGNSIVPVPAALLAVLPERGVVTERKIGHQVVPNVTHTPDLMVAMANRIVQDMLDWDSWEEGRNKALFRLGCRYFELAHTGHLGQDTLRDLFDAAVRTGLTPSEVERTLESASNSL